MGLIVVLEIYVYLGFYKIIKNMNFVFIIKDFMMKLFGFVVYFIFNDWLFFYIDDMLWRDIWGMGVKVKEMWRVV